MKKFLVYLVLFVCIVLSCTKELQNPNGAGNKVELTTSVIRNIASDTAMGGGIILKDGQETITSRGICWSTQTNPTISSSRTNNGSGLGTFNSKLVNLVPNTNYFVRAYAKNVHGTIYGNEVVFRTLASVPTITTQTTTSISYTSAIIGGVINSNGGSPIIQSGVCYSSNFRLPDTTNSTRISSNAQSGTFSFNVSGLASGTKYYVRAYARNGIGFVYANNVDSFTTRIVNPPTLTIVCPSSIAITQTTISLSANVTNNGGASLIQTGFIYSTSPTLSNPITVNITPVSASFTGTITGLIPNTTYYIKSFAKNSSNVNFGYSSSFCAATTLPVNPPTVSNVCTASSITTNSAIVSGNVTNDGGAPIAQLGICYSSSTTLPTVGGVGSNIMSAPTLGLGLFSVNLTGLNYSTSYYFRTFAKNTVNGTYSYGTPLCSFTTNVPSLPLVSNVCSPNALTSTTASISGNITDNGGAPITAAGICYSSTTTLPSVGGAGSLTAAASTLGTGVFTSNLSGLTPGTVYYYRAYARNSSSSTYRYGTPTCNFTTPLLVSVTTTCPTSSQISGTAAVVGGVVSGSTTGQRGICYSTTTSAPTTSNSIFYIGSGVGSFSSTLNGLSPCTTYYIRAFSINSSTGQPVYGQTCTVTTSSSLTSPILTSPANAANLNSASAIIWFTWNSVSCATSYRIQISRSSTFAYASTYTLNTCGGSQYPQGNTINQATVTSPTQFCINSGGSTQNGVWYWRVQAINGATMGPWSTVRYYRYTW